MTTLDECLLPVLSLLTDTAVRATVFLAVVAAVAAVLSRRGASASLRHLVWSLGLAGALFLPLLSRTLPGWNIAVPLPTPPVVAGPEPRGAWGAARQPDLSTPAAATASLPGAFSSFVRSSTSGSPDHGGLDTRNGEDDAPHVPDACVYLILVWSAGTLFALAHLARGLASLRSLESHYSVPVANPRLLQAAAEAKAAMGITRPVALRQALVSMPAVKVPLTYGALRPVIVLPAETANWPPQRLRAALLHEMAHVRRWDWPLQMLAQVVRALYWFHPLAWLALARVRAEGENACDDLVLAAGMPARDYARHLVDVALGARDRSHNPPHHPALAAGIRTGALTMAQTPRVENRVRTILAPKKNRAEVTSAVRAAALGSATAVLVAGAVVRLTASRAQAQVQAQPSLMAGAAGAAGAYPHSPHSSTRLVVQAGGTSHEPEFPEGGRSPAGVVGREAIGFKPVGGYGFPTSALQVRLAPGGSELSVVQTRTGNVLWRGPVSDARFVLETVAAVNTLKHADGRTLWHDEADVAVLDLMLDKSADGAARLFDKSGATLWSGDLGKSSGAASIKQHDDGTFQMISRGVLITGTGGTFSVYSDPQIQAPLPPELRHSAPLRPGPNARLLWSGKLPARPTILIRDGHRYRFTSPNRNETGGDRATAVRFEAEVGQVTITDLQGRTLGTQAVDILNNRHDTWMTPPAPLRIGYDRPSLVQEAELAPGAMGTVLLTYRDSAGRIIRRSKVYRDDQGSGSTNN